MLGFKKKRERERDGERLVFLACRMKGKGERRVKGSPKEIPAGSNTAACKESVSVYRCGKNALGSPSSSPECATMYVHHIN